MSQIMCHRNRTWLHSFDDATDVIPQDSNHFHGSETIFSQMHHRWIHYDTPKSHIPFNNQENIYQPEEKGTSSTKNADWHMICDRSQEGSSRILTTLTSRKTFHIQLKTHLRFELANNVQYFSPQNYGTLPSCGFGNSVHAGSITG